MADTVVSDAVKFPQDDGFANISDGSEPWGSAGYLSLMSIGTANGKFIHDGLTFTGHDATNDQVDVNPGVAVLDLNEGPAVDVQSALGGSSAPAYDTTLSATGAMVVALPTTVTNLDVVDAQTNPIWVAYATDGTVTGVSSGDVYLRHENGGAVSAPPHPSIKIGEANPNDSTQDFRAGYDNPPDKDGWREDPNSPFTTNVTSTEFSMSLAGHYDELSVCGSAWSDRAQDFGAAVTINGDTTSNYTRVIDGSSVVTGASEWSNVVVGRSSSDDVDGTAASRFEFTLTANWPTGTTNNGPQITILGNPVERDGGAIDTWEAGYFTDAMTPPITSVEMQPTNTTGFDIRIFGRHTSSRPNLS